MLARTAAGVAVVQNAIKRGTIVGSDVTSDRDYKTQKAQTRRKGVNVPIRLARLGKKRKVPLYDVPGIDDVTLVESLSERISTAIHFLSRNFFIRYPLAKFLTSRYSIPIIKIRRLRKKLKYRQ